MRFAQSLTFTSAMLLAAPVVRADEQHRHDAGEKLGTVDFRVSCSPVAQTKFQRAAALLHSFAYEDAEKAFLDTAVTDPSCAMAHWGVAMANFHPIWAAGNPSAAPTTSELAKGREAVGRAKALAAPTDRERDFIAAVAAFYDGETADYPARAAAFTTAMKDVSVRHPNDKEAAIFYSLALLGTAYPTDKTYAVQKQAAEILNAVLPQAPDHPGVAHYVIHSFDYPKLAELALPAARAYATIAPSAPHALHMPSHIFVRLGLWDESIAANLASAEAARRGVARNHPGASSFDALHALDYLAYAYLQGGRDAAARKALDEIRAVDKLDVPNFAAAYALAATPARDALERRAWKEAAALTVQPASFPWARFAHAEAIVHFARALGGARGGDLEIATQAVTRLAELQQQVAARKDAYWAGQIEIQHKAAQAWIAKAQGQPAEALRLARAAADLEDATEKHPVTPGSVLPARELLADLLLETGDAKAALAEYEASLGPTPGRFHSLAGAARAAEAMGDAAKSRAFSARLVAQCGKADAARVEVGKARALLAAKR